MHEHGRSSEEQRRERRERTACESNVKQPHSRCTGAFPNINITYTPSKPNLVFQKNWLVKFHERAPPLRQGAHAPAGSPAQSALSHARTCVPTRTRTF